MCLDLTLSVKVTALCVLGVYKPWNLIGLFLPSQSKTYDSITDKFLDFSFEKTNSAYMLFYERCVDPPEQSGSKVSWEELRH